MKDPHHHRIVGYSMIAVAGSLAIIGLIALGIGEDVLYGDKIQRAQTEKFEECKANNFEGKICERYMVFIIAEECIANRDLDSPKCHLYTTYVQSAIFEECRANRDITSPQCIEYIDNIPVESDS
jgi:hypothetical protein